MSIFWASLASLGEFFSIILSFTNIFLSLQNFPHLIAMPTLISFLQHIFNNICFELSFNLPLLQIYNKHNFFKKVTMAHAIIYLLCNAWKLITHINRFSQ